MFTFKISYEGRLNLIRRGNSIDTIFEEYSDNSSRRLLFVECIETGEVLSCNVFNAYLD